MVRDFTFEKYIELCKTILENYTPVTVQSYLTLKSFKKIVIMRHDVDRNPKYALKMAKFESKIGINSTYYFRMKKGIFEPEIIKQISNLGHEIGYHYEVLDKAKGDFEKAIKIFKEELEKFRKICDIKTICMHGNPLSRWLNRDIWKKYDFNDFGIIGEPYLSIDYKSVFYFSDTGRTWDSKYSVKDVLNSKLKQSVRNVKSTDDLIRVIKEGKLNEVCILTHPERWSDNFSNWLKELLLQKIKNFGKVGIRYVRRHEF